VRPGKAAQHRILGTMIAFMEVHREIRYAHQTHPRT
jgi:hypothetical protein